jgi:hypothetical protein
MKSDLKNKILDTAAMQLDFGISQSDMDLISDELDAVDDSEWYWCTFRKAYLICLYGNQDVNKKDDMSWLEPANHCPTLRHFTESVIFPMTTIRPRVIIIRTWPGMEMTEHTDCYKDQLEILEPKLRMVVKGRANLLYFINEDGNEVPISETWTSYIMSGSTIHGMKNTAGEKFTICWGDPWLGDELDNDKFVDFMTEQYTKFEKDAILKSKLGNVDHARGIKDPTVEKIYSWDDWNASKKT